MSHGGERRRDVPPDWKAKKRSGAFRQALRSVNGELWPELKKMERDVAEAERKRKLGLLDDEVPSSDE